MLPNIKDPNFITALLADWGPIKNETNDLGQWLISYNFMRSAESNFANESRTFEVLEVEQANAVRQALSVISDYCNIEFVEVTGGGDISFGRCKMPQGTGAYAYPSNGDIYFDQTEKHWGVGKWQFETVLHEVGHVLGLRHPGDYEGKEKVDNYFVDPSAVGNTAYTAMSYNDYGRSYAGTPMLYDVAALQQLYGAATSASLGNDSYSFIVDRASGWARTVLYDSGGQDTIYADPNKAQLIDLGAGHFSRYLDSTEYQLSIAYGNVIENVVGSNYDDMLIGNSANNRLVGGLGLDTLTGGSGNDTYVVENTGDTISETSAQAREIDTVRSSVAWSLGANLENLILTGNDAIDGNGNRLDNVLIGNAAANTLRGGAGNDIVEGGAGRDMLTGDTGADVFRFSAVLDSYRKYAKDGQALSDGITDFEIGTDKVDLAGLGYTGLGNGFGGTLTLALNETGTRTYVKDREVDATGNRFEFFLVGDYLSTLTSADFIFAAENKIQLTGVTPAANGDWLT